MAPLRAHGVPALSALLALALLALVACSTPPAGSPAVQGSGAPSGSDSGSAVAAASSILSAAKLADASTLGALEGIRFTTAGTDAAASLLASGASGDALWAATYVYASSATDPAPLLAVAANPAASASVRAMAGAALLALGKVEGFDPLIAGLGSAEPMAGADPAGTIWEFAAGVLGRYTTAGLGPGIDATDAERATIAEQWATWLEANKAKLRFDQPSRLWVTA